MRRTLVGMVLIAGMFGARRSLTTRIFLSTTGTCCPGPAGLIRYPAVRNALKNAVNPFSPSHNIWVFALCCREVMVHCCSQSFRCSVLYSGYHHIVEWGEDWDQVTFPVDEEYIYIHVLRYFWRLVYWLYVYGLSLFLCCFSSDAIPVLP